MYTYPTFRHEIEMNSIKMAIGHEVTRIRIFSLIISLEINTNLTFVANRCRSEFGFLRARKKNIENNSNLI